MIDSAVTAAGPGAPEAERIREAFRALRRAEFPWTAERIYLNNAGVGPLPERTRRVMDDLNARRTAPYLLGERELRSILSAARSAAARLINAEVDEIALAPNTSFGLNLAAGALPVEPGERILISDREFPANVYPWLRLKERGIEVELAPTTPEGWPNEEYLLEKLEDPSVRVLAVSLVQFASGYRVDLARLSTACRANGTYLVVDAIQGLGQVPLDVSRTPVDILACGGQKWLLSPWGSGFLYVRRELIPMLEPVVVGWMAFEGTEDFTALTRYDTTLRRDARRFEVGTMAVQDFAGMTESLNLLLELGIERIAAWLKELREPLYRLAAEGKLRLASPTDAVHQSAIVCVAADNLAETYHRLKKSQVDCVMREGTIRLSPHFYNIPEEMEKVAGILAQG
ncbi:Isopenicillin N epimerase [bacterium HR33]|nr:Isopenicillin N epimerase [bacterium HR33]